MSKCERCGGKVGFSVHPGRVIDGRRRGLGSSTTRYCTCLKTVHKRGASSPRPKSQKSSGLSVAEQLAVLADLREQGSLTEQEFQTMKNRLISGD